MSSLNVYQISIEILFRIYYFAKLFFQPATHFVQSSRSVLSTLDDQSISQQLSSTSQQLHSDLGDLRGAISRAKPACQGLGLDAAAELIASLSEELEEFEKALNSHSLRPLPGDNAESCAYQLSTTSKDVNNGIAQLLSAASQGNEVYTAQAARETAHNLRYLTNAVRGVAATANSEETQKGILYSAQDIMQHSSELIEEAKRTLQSPQGGISPALAAAAKNVSNAIGKTVSCLPGQRDVDYTLTEIREWTTVIECGSFPQTNKSYGQLQQELNNAAANLNEASTEVVTSVRNPVQLASSTKDFGLAFHDLLNVSMEMAGQTQDNQVRGEMVHSLKNISVVSSTLLNTAKSVSADPNMPNGKNQLAAAARAVTDSINSLLDVYTSATPGQSECDNAIRNIQAMKPLLDNPNESVNDFSYYDCLDSVMEKSKLLGEGMTGITNAAKQSNHDKFGDNVKNVNIGICGLVEAAAQASYLVSFMSKRWRNYF